MSDTFDEALLARCLELLAQVGADDALESLEGAVEAAHRRIKKRGKARRRAAAQAADHATLEQAHRVQIDQASAAADVAAAPPQGVVGHWRRPRRCYVCKERYDAVDAHYHMLCPACAAANHQRRLPLMDLRGRRALVTGGRAKIGHRVALHLLRSGAAVTVTTRFPRDAARRFAAYEDAAAWGERLRIVGLELRDLPALLAFLDAEAAGPPLDILINNAAQTVRRPPAFFQALALGEAAPLDAAAARLLGAPRGELAPREVPGGALATFHALCAAAAPQDEVDLARRDPEGLPLDLRAVNSWTMALAEVPPAELAEVLVVNAMAPFLLNSRLRPAMERAAAPDRYIVNVSAVEGQFAYANKTPRHPHTNMAKAALNMMTRTSGQDYAASGIYMTSVDTGWVTEENPLPVQDAKKSKGFYPPLDVVDGAARVLDPIARGVNAREFLWGCFLKDFQPVPW